MTTLDLSAGVRYLVFSDIVNLSVYAMLGGTYAYIGGSSLDTSGHEVILGAGAGSWAYAIGGNAGLALERRLIDRLAVRLSAALLDVYWTDSRVKTIDSTGAQLVIKPKGVSAGLTLEPALELRFYF